MKRVNKNKIYNFIGRAVVYSSLYIATVAFSVWGFLQGTTYQEGKMIYLLLTIAIICVIVYYKMTGSLLATVLYGIYAISIIYVTSLLLVQTT